MMFRCKFTAITIISAGYDPQRALLEVKVARNGEVWQYQDVPEELWYRFKGDRDPDVFFRRYIQGCYAEQQAFSEEE